MLGDQLYVLAPDKVHTTESPEQIVAIGGVMVNWGKELIDTEVETISKHPFASVPVSI